MSVPVLLGVLVSLAMLLYVLAPLLWPRAFAESAPANPEVVEGEVASLERLRDDLFARIVDLDFDHEVGKTDEEEYRQERADLKRQALAALRLLDERAAPAGVVDGRDEAIERAIHEERARRAAPAAARTAAMTPTACAECGRLFAVDDRFCAGCGAPRAAVAPPAAIGDQALDDEVERQVLALRRRRAGAPASLASANGRRAQ